MAEEKELDLVEISMLNLLFVVLLITLNFLSIKETPEGAESEAGKSECKGNSFRPQTDDHDYNFKLKHARLEDGDKGEEHMYSLRAFHPFQGTR